MLGALPLSVTEVLMRSIQNNINVNNKHGINDKYFLYVFVKCFPERE